MVAQALEAFELTKRYGSRVAVEDLSFSVGEGEVVGLLGPNGAGKTTTIRLLTTVLTPTSGTLSVVGVPSTQPLEIRRRVGVLPESAGYPVQQTGAEFLRYHARLFGLPRPEAARVSARLLAEVGLAERGGSRIGTYSRGMRQRLGIARALVHDPAVVILDEPTLGLDPAGQQQVLQIVREVVQRRGATVVLSTHTLPDVEEVCTSVLILDRGRLVASGPIGAVARAAGRAPAAEMQVPPDRADHAVEALRRVPDVTVAAIGDRPGVLMLSVEPGGDANAALAAVLDAGVPVLSYRMQGARLSDAFLTVTGGGQ